MNPKEIAETYELPIKAILLLRDLGLISKELDQSRDHAVLRIITKIWGNHNLLRWQLASMPKAKRLSLIKTCEYNKLERYVHSRFKNHHGRLPVAAVARELQKFYGVPITEDLMTMIRRVRKSVRNRRAYTRLKAENEYSGFGVDYAVQPTD